MKRGVLALAVLAALTMAVRPLAAQQEVQVPLDEQGRIHVLDAATARQLGVFVDRYPGFHEARLLLLLPDSSYVLEITSLRAGQTVRERVPQTRAEIDALRRQLTERITARPPAALLDQEGRGSLLATTTLLGLTFYGWAVPYSLGDMNEQTAAALYMLTAGASFFVPWTLTRNIEVTRGMAELTAWGATRGAIHGLVLDELIQGPDDPSHPDDFFYEEDEERASVRLALLGSLAEGIAGYAYAQRRGLDHGTARSIGAGGDIGLVYGWATSYLVDLPHRAIAASALAGSAAGVVLGNRYAALRAPTPGNVSVLSTAGMLGAYSALTVLNWTGSEEDRAYVAAGMAGGLAGLAIADRKLAPLRLTEPQARLIGLGTIAGGAIGFGIAYLFFEDSSDETPYLTASALGALGGFALTYRAVAQRPDVGLRESRLRIDMHPTGLAGLARRTERGPALPLVSGRLRI
jgi:hypothetical protein